MAGPVRTEGVVLRSIRYGEADRIVHLYTPRRGRVSAIAKGVRRARSRFGGRLEPFFRLELMLHEGRSELLTVTGAETITGHPRLRTDARALDAAARACDAVARLFDTDEAHPAVYNLLCHELALLDARAGASGAADEARAGAPSAAHDARAAAPSAAQETHANQVAFRLKLLLAAGLAPQLEACASCGAREHLTGFSGAAGGVVCAACEANSFPLDEAAHAFMTGALGAPLAAAPAAPERALRQAERAVAETLEHHAGVRLRTATPG
jgi:DNA repair protein RecO (recombination protein O)